MLHGRKKRAVKWLTTPSEKAYSLKEALFFAVFHLLALGLLLTSGLCMLSDVWEELVFEKKYVLFLSSEGLFCALFYDVALPFLGGIFPKKEKAVRGTLVLFGLLLLARVLVKVYWEAPLEMEDGLLIIGNSLLERYNAFHHTAYSMDLGKAGYYSYSMNIVLAALIFGFYNLTCLTKKNFFWVLPPALVLGALLLCAQAPSFLALGLFLVGFYLLSSTDTVWRVGRPVDERGFPKRERLAGEALQKLAVVALLSIGMLAVFVIGEKPAQGFATKSRVAVAVRETFLKKKQGGGEYFDFDFLTRSSKVTNRAPKYQDTKILKVTTDGPVKGNLYLKDFEGMDYRSGKWISGDAQLRSYCIRDDMDENAIRRQLNEAGYHAFEQGTNQLLYSVWPTSVMQYRIQYQKIEGEIYPLPGFVNTEEMADRSLVGDVLVKRNYFKSRISFSALNKSQIPSHDVAALTEREMTPQERTLWRWYDTYVELKYLEVPDVFSETGERKSSAAAQIAAGLGQMGSYGSATQTNNDRVLLAGKAASYLRGMQYSWDLDKLKKGTDPVEYFLTKGQKGYCSHFASAGVLIMRGMGIPARYAEGYIVKQDAFQEMGDGTYEAQVLDRNRHAWVEIYLDRVGWIPVEVTPGYIDTSASLQTDADREQKRQEQQGNPQESGERPEEPDEPETTQAPPEQESMSAAAEPDEEDGEEISETESGAAKPSPSPEAGGWYWPGLFGGNGSGQAGGRSILALFGNLLLAGAILIGVVFGIVCLVRSRVRAYYRVVEEEFAHQKYVAVVRRINRRMIASLRRTGRMRKRFPTDAEYAECLKKTFPDIPQQDWDTYMAIVKEAAFSADILQKERAEFCKNLYHKVRLLGRESI